MTVSELIDRLENYLDEMGDVEVRLMTQANYPFEYGIVGLASSQEIDETEDTDHLNDEDDVDDVGVVYIVEGNQLRYGTARAWEAAH